MGDDLSERLRIALSRMPDWLRRDFSTRDEATRQRAEDALAAMIVSALAEHACNEADRPDYPSQIGDPGG